MRTICICGAGTMGGGIAQVCAQAGFQTLLYDINKQGLEKAKDKIEADLTKLVDKGKLSLEEKQATLSRLIITSDITSCKADLIIEAVVERMEVKIDLFNQLGEINDDKAIYASNTSSLSINAIARAIRKANRFAGIHFFNPAPVMKLVEIVKGENTSTQIINDLITFTKALGKTPVVCIDSPGFIVNRVARPFYIESLRLLEEGKASLETIDKLLMNAGFKMGPFALMDLIGNDINYAVSCSVYEQLNEPVRLKPSFIQKEKVENNDLGRKTGKGYYDYH